MSLWPNWERASWRRPGDPAVGVSSHRVVLCAESSPLVALAFQTRQRAASNGGCGWHGCGGGETLLSSQPCLHGLCWPMPLARPRDGPPCGDESRRHTAHRTPTAQTPPFTSTSAPSLLPPIGCCASSCSHFLACPPSRFLCTSRSACHPTLQNRVRLVCRSRSRCTDVALMAPAGRARVWETAGCRKGRQMVRGVIPSPRLSPCPAAVGSLHSSLPRRPHVPLARHDKGQTSALSAETSGACRTHNRSTLEERS